MRNKLNTVLKEFLQTKLKMVKGENHLTQETLAYILQIDRRTLAGVLRGEYSFGSLSTMLFLMFLVNDSGKEIQNLREQFVEILGEEWEKQMKKALGNRK